MISCPRPRYSDIMFFRYTSLNSRSRVNPKCTQNHGFDLLLDIHLQHLRRVQLHPSYAKLYNAAEGLVLLQVLYVIARSKLQQHTARRIVG